MKILVGFLFVLVFNSLLFLSQIAMDRVVELEGGISPQIYNYDGSLLKKYDAGNYTIDEDVTGKLPTGQGQIEPTSGNFFTDTFSTIKNWFLESTGLNYVLGFLNAFPNLLKGIGIYPELAFVLGVIWNATGLLLLVLVLKGHY